MEIKKIKALIVDDDPRFSALLKKTLENKKCEVQTTQSDLGTLKCLINDTYHIVFLDCVLKDKSGMELSHKIREILGDSVHIIMMSGVVSAESVSTYVNLDVFDFLSKPIAESEIDINLKKVKEKYIYGKQDNFLLRFFRENVSEIESLKNLVSLNKVSGIEFFLYLSSALSTKSSLQLKFSLNDKNYKLCLYKGRVIDFKHENSLLFLNRLVSSHLIQKEEAMPIVGKSEEEVIKYLLSEFLLSPDQIIAFKYDLLVEVLKSISPDSKISLNFEIINSSQKKESFTVLTQSEYADIVFLCLKEKFKNQIFHFFDASLMDRHIIFAKESNKDHIVELEPIIEDLKLKMKLSSLHKKHLQDKNIFCFCILYILLRGDAFLSGMEELDYDYFFERFKKLEHFFQNTDKKKLFHIMAGLDFEQNITSEDVKAIYNAFLKKNHPDFFQQYNLPQKILNQVGRTTTVLKKVYEDKIDPKLKTERKSEFKDQEVKRMILLTEKKKLLERYLVEKNYELISSLLGEVSEASIQEDLEWQLLLGWYYLKIKKDRKKEKKLLKIMTFLQKNKKQLDKNRIYYYIFGLNYIIQSDYTKALQSFEICKKLDYSFQPVYESIKEASLMKNSQKKSENSFLKRLKNLKLGKKVS